MEIETPVCVDRLQFVIYAFGAGIATMSFLKSFLYKHKPLALPQCILLYNVTLPIYIPFLFVLSAISMVKVLTGSTGEWAVTSRWHGAPEEAQESGLGLLSRKLD